MVKNAEGKIALRWAVERRNPKPVNIGGTNRTYFFSPKNCNIFLAWVEEQDVPILITKRIEICKCQGGTYGVPAKIASRLDVLLWDTGSRDGEWNSTYTEIADGIN